MLNVILFGSINSIFKIPGEKNESFVMKMPI